MSMRLPAGILRPGYNPLLVANAPTIGTATVASATSVSVAFTAPSCTGGSVISTYTAYCTTTGTNTATGASSPLVVSGLTTGQTYTFQVVATNIYGPSYPSAASNSVIPAVIGQQAYTTAGTYSWVAPAGVTAVSVVAVGAGAGCSGTTGSGTAGGGGGLGYKNNYSVTPGSSYTVVVGLGGIFSSGVGSAENSYFVSTSVVLGGGGIGGGSTGAGGTFAGDGGGNGGQGGSMATNLWAGGGGAGGYSGNGGAGGNSPSGAGSAGSGGGGGGGTAQTTPFTGSGVVRGGGGVGILGAGANGSVGGGGGSGGASATDAFGGLYGGGSSIGSRGANGAVRIIWPGTTRQFPSTNTGNL